MFLLLTAILGPQSDHHYSLGSRSNRGSRGHGGGGSDWSWLTGSGGRSSHRHAQSSAPWWTGSTRWW
jgi:hypothetical protein